jgi:hypothetical protein
MAKDDRGFFIWCLGGTAAVMCMLGLIFLGLAAAPFFIGASLIYLAILIADKAEGDDDDDQRVL